ncbi:MAG: D-alanyl-D-alanine carboxypeptidase [Clostridiales bacterium]|nr:D-alanyl-D-alanine carboxypeptidase [Clostridiales bacterium]
MFKKLAACIAALMVAFTLVPSMSFADGFDPNEVSTPYIVLMEASSGTVLFEKNAHEHSFPASTTKVMTCILALEQCPDLDITVTVGENVETRGSTMGIVRREELSMRSLLYGLMLRSGNDAAKAIAEHISGSESAFADLMNQKAASLGMTDTHFVKSNGLHNDDHYCSAYDMALLTRYALKNEEFRSIVSAPTYDVPPTNKDSNGYQLTNSNKLIYTKEGEESYEYHYATGVKTGDTDYAGRCLVASAERDGVELILVLFGDYSNKVSTNYRFENAAKFFDWGFANYDSLDPTLLNLETEFAFPVTGSDTAELTAAANLDGITVTDKKDVIAAIEADPSLIVPQTALTRKLEAPIAAGEVIGTVAYQYQSATLFSVDLVAVSAVEPAPIETVPEPSASPLIAGTPDIDTEEGDKEKGSSLVFWIVLLVVLLVIVLAAKAVATTRRRRRRARKRRAYRSNYPRR